MSTVTPITPQDMIRPRLEDGYVRIINTWIENLWERDKQRAVVRLSDILGRAAALGEVSFFYADQVKPFYEAVGWDVRYCPDALEGNPTWVFSIPD